MNVAQLVKNPPAMQGTRFDSWVRKICWRRDRLLTPAFLDFPGGSAGEESACNVGDLGFTFGLGGSPGEGKGTHSSVVAKEFHGLDSLWGHKESDTTERLSLFTMNWWVGVVRHKRSLCGTNDGITDWKTEREPVVLPFHVLCLPFACKKTKQTKKNFSQRINLIREVRKFRSKAKQSNKTK